MHTESGINPSLGFRGLWTDVKLVEKKILRSRLMRVLQLKVLHLMHCETSSEETSSFWIRTQMVDHDLEIIYKAGGWWWWCRKRAGGMDFVVQKLAMELLESGMRLLTVPGIECNSRKHSCMLSISSDCLTVKNTDRIACAASCHPRLQRKAPAQAPPLLCKKTKQTMSASFSSASCSTILIRKKSGKEGWGGTRSWRNLQ